MLTLTAGVNTYEGTEGDDTFNAEIGTFGNNTDIDAKDGVDTLNAEYSSDLATGPTLTSVEVVNLTNLVGASREINTVNFSDVEQIWNVGSQTGGDVALTNVDSTDITLGIKNTKAGMSVRYSTDALGAATDDVNVNVELSAADGGSFSVGPQSVLAAGRVNSLTINSAGSENKLGTITDSSLTDKSLETITITGDQKLSISGFAAPVETIDAGTLENSLVVSVGNLLTDDLTVIGGTGDANKVTANVTADVAATLTNIQNFDLTFTDGKVFDAENTTVAAAYTLKGAGSANIDNIIAGSTFTTNNLDSGAAGTGSSFGFLGLGDFDLAITNSGSGNGAAVNFQGIDFTNVRDVTVTSANKSASALGAVDLGDLGRSVSLTADAAGDVTAGAITVGNDNVFAQELNLTANDEGDVAVTSYDAKNSSLTATLTANEDGNVDVTADLTSVNAMSLTMTANDDGAVAVGGDVISSSGSATVVMHSQGAGTVDVTGNIQSRSNATVTLVAEDEGDVTVAGFIKSTSGSTTVDATTALVSGGDVIVTGDIEGRGAVTVTGTAVQDTSVTYNGNVKSTNSGAVIVDLSGAAGDANDVGGDATIGNIDSTSGDVTVTLDAGAYAEATTGNVKAVSGSATIVATAGVQGEAGVGSVESTVKGVDLTLTATAAASATADTAASVYAGTVKGGTDAVVTLTAGAYREVTTTSIEAASGSATVTVDAGRAAEVATGTITATKAVTLDVTTAAGTSTVAGGTADVGAVKSATAGNVDLTLTSGAYGTLEVSKGATVETTKGDITVTVVAGRDATTEVGAVKAVDGDVTLDITASATAGAGTVTFGAVEGETIVLTGTVNDDLTVAGLESTITDTGVGNVITADLSGTADVDLGALVVTTKTGNTTLINAENLTGALTVTVSDVRDTIVLGDGADEVTVTALGDSLLAAYDKIIGFNVAADTLDVDGIIIDATDTGTAVIDLGSIASLTAANISTAVSGNLLVDQVGYFTVGTQKFLIVNDDTTADFGASDDAIIEITGMVGDIADLYFA